MLRYGLLGGVRPEAPWEMFIAVGGASLAAGALFAVLFPLWSTYPIVGVLELVVFAVAGGALLLVGWLRRQKTARGK